MFDFRVKLLIPEIRAVKVFCNALVACTLFHLLELTYHLPLSYPLPTLLQVTRHSLNYHIQPILDIRNLLQQHNIKVAVVLFTINSVLVPTLTFLPDPSVKQAI